MLRRVALVRIDVSEDISSQDSCHTDDGGDIFPQNISFYKSYMM
jgi:hypothetical protein